MMPTTCCVVNCFNHHSKDSDISFYRFPVNLDRRRRWIAFVSRRNEDGSPWQPGNGDRICSEHFISKQKSEIPSNPDYVPSIQSRCDRATNGETDQSGDSNPSLNHFERVQRHVKKAAEQQRLQEIEQERVCTYLRQTQKAFQHDHGFYCKQASSSRVEIETLGICGLDGSNTQCLIDSTQCLMGTAEEITIPVEVGKKMIVPHIQNCACIVFNLVFCL